MIFNLNCCFSLVETKIQIYISESMPSLQLYTKIIPRVNSIVSKRQAFLNHPVQNAIQSTLISSNLIIQQKRTGTAKPKCKL